MTKLNDILYARERLALEHPYAEAFRFIRDKILLGLRVAALSPRDGVVHLDMLRAVTEGAAVVVPAIYGFILS